MPYTNTLHPEITLQGQRRLHYRWLDVVRAVSALLIILFHYTYRYNYNSYVAALGYQADYPFQLPWGSDAVITFFMLSGFLMAGNINKIGTNAFNFIKKRLWRLYPTFWVCLTITTLVLLPVFPEIPITLKQYVVNLTMIPSNFDVPFIDGAYWTMAYEIKFAAIFFAILLFRKVSARKLLLAIWLMCAILLGAFQKSVHPTVLFLVRGIFITDLIHTFVGGMAIARLNDDKPFYITLLTLCIANHFFWYNLAPAMGLFFVVTAVVLLMLPKLEKIHIADRIYKPLEFIALISYPLYLLHQMIGFGIIRHLISAGLTAEIWLLVPFAISVAAAYLVHKYIEVPTAKWDFKLWPKILAK